jgi:hypothetical protein
LRKLGYREDKKLATNLKKFKVMIQDLYTLLCVPGFSLSLSLSLLPMSFCHEMTWATAEAERREFSVFL